MHLKPSRMSCITLHCIAGKIFVQIGAHFGDYPMKNHPKQDLRASEGVVYKPYEIGLQQRFFVSTFDIYYADFYLVLH